MLGEAKKRLFLWETRKIVKERMHKGVKEGKIGGPMGEMKYERMG